ncbi:MAG: hypothetical protein WBK28_02465 [Minisyncoccia bacterium]
MLAALLLVVFALIGWWFFMFVLKPLMGFSFVHTPLRTLSYFLILMFGITYFYFPYTGRLFGEPSVASLIFLGTVLVGINPWLYRFARNEHRVRVPATPAHPDLELLVLDGRFLLSKLGDVVFQQTVIGTLILMFAGIPLLLLSILCACVFLVGHLGLIARLPAHWSAYFLFSAFVGGAGIPYLILMIPGGFFYAVALHMLWYVLTGAFYWTVEARRRTRTLHRGAR